MGYNIKGIQACWKVVTLLLLSNALDLYRCMWIPSLMRFNISRRLASAFFRGDLRFRRCRFLKVSAKLIPDGAFYSVWECGEGGEEGAMKGLSNARIWQSRLRFCRWTACMGILL
jgi:hypothetical protein